MAVGKDALHPEKLHSYTRDILGRKKSDAKETESLSDQNVCKHFYYFFNTTNATYTNVVKPKVTWSFGILPTATNHVIY
jgi:hypothetical protein